MRLGFVLSLALALSPLAAPFALAAPAPRPATATALCPVCAVREGSREPERVKATRVHAGASYSFCSAECARAFDADPAAYVPAALPRPAPSFAVTALDGRKLSLADYRGKPLYLDFWATWCAPCVKVIPELQKLYDDFSGRGLAVLGVSIDEGGMKKVKAFAAARRIGYPLALDDRTPSAWEAYRVKAVPAAFLIDAEGRVVRQWTGRVDPAEVRAAVEALLPRTD